MLHLITGRAKSGKTQRALNILKDKACSGDDRLILIVPEQFSYTCEAMLIELCGPKNASNIQVLSFTRLSSLIFRQYGGSADVQPDKISSVIIMADAVSSCPDLQVYKNDGLKQLLPSDLVSLHDELAKNGVSLKDDIIPDISDEHNALKMKCHDLSSVFSMYDALCEKAGFGTVDPLLKACSQAHENNWFEGYTIVADAFRGFTSSQSRMLLEMFGSCDTYVTMCTEKCTQTDISDVFFHTSSSAASLTDLAKKNNIRVFENDDIKEPASPHFESEALSFLEQGLFTDDEESFGHETSDIQICSCPFPDTECDFIAANIKKLLESDSTMRARDIAVLSTGINPYLPALGHAFRKYGVPYFSDIRVPLCSHALVTLIRTLLLCSVYGINTDRLLSYMKCGLTDYTLDETSLLEQYLFTWDTDGKDLCSPFTRSPSGFSQNNADDLMKLEKIESTRKKAISEISAFMLEVKNASPKTISTAIYNALKTCRAAENMKCNTGLLEDDALRSEQQRIWDTVMDILNKMAVCTQSAQTGTQYYLNVFSQAITKADLGTVPYGLDNVVTGDADRSRLTGIRAVFICGAYEGNFPKIMTDSGILSSSDRRIVSLILEQKGSALDPSGDKAAAQQRFIAYSALCTASQKLFITYPRASYTGDEYQQSSLSDRIARMFGITPLSYEDTDPELYASSPDSAAALYAKLYSCKDEYPELISALEQVLTDHGMTSRINTVRRIAGNEPFEINNKQTAHDLFMPDNKMNISATNFEMFYECPFAYFCHYGMHIKKPEKARISASVYGSAVHSCLEHLLKNNDFGNMNDGELTAAVRKQFGDYLETQLGGSKDKTKRFMANYGRMCSATCDMALVLRNDMHETAFRTQDTEHPILRDITDEKSGVTIHLNGSVDRFDIMQTKDTGYFRVIDYKTGSKDFELYLAENGINSQMFIYLFALAEENKKLVPAGVIYYKLSGYDTSFQHGAKNDDLKKARQESIKASGAELSQQEVIENMPALRTKMDEEAVNDLKNRLDELIRDMPARLSDGEIQAFPADYKGSGFDSDTVYSCRYCDYKAVCGFENGPVRFLKKDDRGESDETGDE